MNKIQRLKKLNDLLRCHQGYTILELMAELDAGESTVRKDLEQIQKPPFNAKFNFVFRGKERLYRYKDLDYSLPLFKSNDEIKKKLDTAIKAIEKYIENSNSIPPHYEWLKLCLIAIENDGIFGSSGIMSFDYNAKLKGIEYLTSLSDAIINKYPVKLTYHPYFSDVQFLYVHPYHLKQYNNRWLGKVEGKEQLQNYAIDRIKGVEHLSKQYIETDVDFDDFFKDVIGVSVNDVPVDTIELKVNKRRYNYIRTKPLHHSQTEIKSKETEETVTLTLKLKINKELVSTLLSYGADVVVVAPDRLRTIIMKEIDDMYSAYKIEKME